MITSEYPIWNPTLFLLPQEAHVMHSSRNPTLVGVFGLSLYAAAGVVSFDVSPALASPAPSVKVATAPLVSPGTADTFYGASTTHTYHATFGYGAGSSNPRPPEIVELARALKNDPDLIYEYVRNTIRINFAYGLQKGALGAVIDHSGTAFDQAQLMVELLRQANYTASYKIGTITLNAAQWTSWSGFSDAKASCQFLAAGGIPASFAGSSDPACAFTGPVTTVTLGHVWVEASIGGQAYVFDPAYKPHTFKAGLNLATVLGFTPGTPLAQATATGFTESTVNTLKKFRLIGGSASTMPQVSPYAANLTGYLRANLPAAELADVIGGQTIDRVTVPVGGFRLSTLPYTAAASRTITGDIPDPYRTSLRVYVVDPSVGTGTLAFDRTFFVDEVYGRRMRLDTNWDWATAQTGPAPLGTLGQDNTFRISLTVDGVEQAFYITTLRKLAYASRFKRKLDITLVSNHPYAAATPAGGPPREIATTSGVGLFCQESSTIVAGTYADRCVNKTAYALTAVSIVHGWGDIDQSLVAKWGGEAAEDKPSPRLVFGVICGVASQPLSGSGCVTQPLPAGDFTRDRIAATWLGQFSRMLDMQARIGGGRGQHHETLGVVYSDTTTQYINYDPDVLIPGTSTPVLSNTAVVGATDEMTVVDVDSEFSMTSLNANAVDRRAAVYSVAAMASALEGSVVNQILNLPHYVSTAQRFLWSNAPYGAIVLNDGTVRQRDVTDFFFLNQGGSTSTAPFTPDTAARSFYIVNGSNRAQMTAQVTLAGVTTGQPSWVNQSLVTRYKNSFNDAIQLYASTGYNLVASEESLNGPGTPDGAWVSFDTAGNQPTYYFLEYSKQRGGAFVATRVGADGEPYEIAHVVSNLNGLHKGGGAGSSTSAAAAFSAETVAGGLKSRFSDRSRVLGVDLRSGRVGYTTPTLITTGSAAPPFSLSSNLIYTDPSQGSAPPAAVPFNNFSSTFPTAFRGFTHSWDVRLNYGSDGFEALGVNSAQAAAEAIAAFVVMQDMNKSAAGVSSLQSPVEIAQATSAIVAHYLALRISHNTVSVQQAGATRKFVRLTLLASGGGVDWTHFLPPRGEFSDLVQTVGHNVLYPACFRGLGGWDFQQNATYDYTGVNFTLKNAGGDVQTFTRWQATNAACRPYGGFVMSEWSFPQGPKYVLTYANGRLTKVENRPGGSTTAMRSLNFAQSAAATTNTVGAVQGIYATNQQLSGTIKDESNRTVSYSAQTNNTITLIDGGVMRLVYNAPIARSATQRPIPWPTLKEVYEPISSTNAAIRFTYDTVGAVKEVRDATSIAQGDAVRGPYKFYIGDGARGEREDPLTPAAGRYAVYYDDRGRSVRHVDELGREVTSAYDGLDRLLTRTYPEGDQEVLQYDARNNVTQMTRKAKLSACTPVCPADIVMSATWDTTWNRPLTVTNALGHTTTLTYYVAGTAGAGRVKDALRPAATAGGVQPKYTYTYAANTGLLTQETTPIGNTQTTFVTTNHTYDTKGNRTKTVIDDTTTGLKLKTEYQFNAYGDVTRAMDQRGYVTDFTYWQNATTASGTGITRRLAEKRSSSNALAAVTGAVTGYLTGTKTWYDLNGRVSKVEGPSSISGTTITWNTTNPRSQVTYTETGKVAAAKDAVNDTTSTAYDQLDRASIVTDPIGRKVKTVYDAAGQVTQVIRAFGSPLQQIYSQTTYSANGQPLTVTDARGFITKMEYDGFDRSTKLLYPDTTPANDNDNLYEQFTYDDVSRKVTSRTRAGQIVTFGYDRLDRMTSRTGAGLPDRTFTYDLGGRGISIKDADGATTVAETLHTYDTAGRLTIEHRNDWNKSVTYTLDASGNMIGLTWPDGFQAAYTYDGLGRTTRIANGATVYRTYTYDVLARRVGQVAMEGVNQTATTYTHELDDDLASLTHNYPGASADLAYTFSTSSAGQLLSTATSDPLHRYVDFAPVGTKSYGTANPLNQYPTISPVNASTVTLGYDANGNLTNDGASAYTYDATNRLLMIVGLVNASYGYDAKERRTQKTSSNVTTRFLHAGTDEIAEYSSAGALLRRYVPAAGVDERAVLVDSGLVAPPASALRFPHTDRQGTVVSVTDSTGAVSERFTYDIFGRSTSPMSGYPFRYTGQRLDSESGLMFYKARVYSQALGRFLQTDPIGTKDDLNLYAYVGNDPINKADPTGMWDEEIARQQEALRRAQHASSDRMMSETWTLMKQYHPAGAPFQTYDELRAGQYEGAMWAVGTAGALKVLSYGGGFAGKYVQEGWNWLKGGCCFTAGTLVATKDGLRPIESIKVGDLVLSRDEETGETTYKPVKQLVPKHPRVVWRVTFAVSRSGASKTNEVSFDTTNNHPWRLATGVWVETKDLTRGMQVVRADGSLADVVSVLDTGKASPLYNLEVADFHTYFVGENQLWVHNCGETVKGLWKITKEGTEEVRNHGKFGKFYKSKGAEGEWWTKDNAEHGGSVWKVYKEEADGLHWIADADEYGDFIENKHKGPTGMFIPWDRLIPVKW